MEELLIGKSHRKSCQICRMRPPGPRCAKFPPCRRRRVRPPRRLWHRRRRRSHTCKTASQTLKGACKCNKFHSLSLSPKFQLLRWRLLIRVQVVDQFKVGPALPKQPGMLHLNLVVGSKGSNCFGRATLLFFFFLPFTKHQVGEALFLLGGLGLPWRMLSKRARNASSIVCPMRRNQNPGHKCASEQGRQRPGCT